MTVSERRLWSHLRRRQVEGWKFRRQAPIGDYIVDFLCIAAKLVVELDGSSHNETRSEYDQCRQEWLESQGYTVLRFSSDYPEDDPIDGVVEAVYLELAGLASSRLPSRAQRKTT
jgi:very-short-patch-repair endonuclease